MNLGLAFQKSGDQPKALDCLEKAHRLRPEDPAIARQYGLLLAKSGRPNEAASVLGQAVRLTAEDEALTLKSGVDPERVYVIPNGVETNLFKPGLKLLKISSPKKFKFLLLGGTIHRKGPDLLLNAYQQAFGAHDDVVLVIKDTGTQSVYQGQGIGAEELSVII